MTDAQIIEALGWPAGRPDAHPRSLFHRIRAVVAAAQAEQIERIRAALVGARAVIVEDRGNFEFHARSPDGKTSERAAATLADYNRRLALIDAALEGEPVSVADELPAAPQPPVQQRRSMTDEELSREFERVRPHWYSASEYNAFRIGVKTSERHHKIGEEA